MGNLYRFVEPLVLYLLKKHGRSYGYELVEPLQKHALTDSAVEPGVIYKTLRRLEESGNVTSYWDAGSAGPARRNYELTEKGEKHLQEWIAVLEHLAHSMSGFIQEAKETVADQ